ncbi:ABC transporter permease [Zhihengliuella salsuginis]|uniref:ABC transporter n=1 Tax=Zhihengliuella salsuginis TaxID=578222 RepID=A0ABQ3GCE9_9MICC|nr:ABC transporter permease [Zhihengliuella salsuginis]GHD01537.1 ABC transporter [Zhihengliuella salsuginis]
MTETTPAPAAPSNAASVAQRILRHGGYETTLMLRNGEQLVLAVVLPLLALVALTFVDLLDGVASSRIEAAAPGVLALCVMSTAFTGQGIATGFDRRYGVLTFLSTTPLGRVGLIFGKALAVLAVLAVQLVVVGGTALLMGWRPDPLGTLIGLGLLLAGAAAFTSLGLLIAGTVRPEATLAITNLAWILLAAAGGILIPGSHLPGVLPDIVQVLPSAALGDAMRAALIDGTVATGSVVVLLAWAAVAGTAATRWFKWT